MLLMANVRGSTVAGSTPAADRSDGVTCTIPSTVTPIRRRMGAAPASWAASAAGAAPAGQMNIRAASNTPFITDRLTRSTFTPYLQVIPTRASNDSPSTGHRHDDSLRHGMLAKRAICIPVRRTTGPIGPTTHQDKRAGATCWSKPARSIQVTAGKNQCVAARLRDTASPPIRTAASAPTPATNGQFTAGSAERKVCRVTAVVLDSSP